MPEGDTIFRTARTLRAVLQGRRVRAARARQREPGISRLAGLAVASVEARGKNLLIGFDDGSTLYTHMRMSGSWHVYRHGETWSKPERRARVVLETAEAVAVCFSAPVVRLLSPLQARHHRPLVELGPDLLAPSPDLTEALRRMRPRNDVPIGEALMSQHLVAGIGNVYKSETLFLMGVDPFARLASLTDEAVIAVLDRARALMRRNLDGFPRRTRPVGEPGRYWVYGRAGSACRRCGTPIEMRRQGEAARSTYYCPRCQGSLLQRDLQASSADPAGEDA